MGMGYGAVNVIHIEEDELEKLNLETYKEFRLVQEKLNLTDYDLHMIVINYSVEYSEFIDLDVDDADKEIIATNVLHYWDAFHEEFKKETGVSIYLNYHDSDDYGSNYDDINGLHFTLEFSDLYEETEVNKKLSEKVYFDWKSYVVYG